jgi:hypothetical protein
MLTDRVTLADADRTTIMQIGSVVRIDVECGTTEEAALSFRAIVEQLRAGRPVMIRPKTEEE